MDEIRIGLFGLGLRGLAWLRGLQRLDNYRITAIGDIFPGLHQRGLDQLENSNGVKTYADYDDFLANPDIDAVALTVRCEQQGAMAAMALEAGKHVNAEVPAAHTMEDCWRIVVATERSGLVYQLAEQQRYAGYFGGWQKLVKEGKLGHIVYFEGEYISYKMGEPASRKRYHQDWDTGEMVASEDLHKYPNAKPNWRHQMPPAHYFVHDLSPILMILDDRVTTVTGMGTRRQSYAHPELKRADIQVGLMKTTKDTVVRMAQGATQMIAPNRDHHHFQMIGTKGSVESGRSWDSPHKMWLADSQMHGPATIDWRYERTDAPKEAVRSGHFGMDYYVHVAFRDAILHNKPLEFDVYKAMDTAAPAILTADSIDRGSEPIEVPDFTPGKHRPHGTWPEVSR